MPLDHCRNFLVAPGPPVPHKLVEPESRVFGTSQMLDYSSRGGHTAVLRRSTFGLVSVWGALPAWVVDTTITNTFQRLLQQCLMRWCDLGIGLVRPRYWYFKVI